jgi:hypothetical protein
LKNVTGGSGVAGVSTNVAYASCIEALVAVLDPSTTDGSSKAKRPSNLLTGNSGWTNTDAFTKAKLECQKLPSMGLYVVAENSAWKPVLPKEVCQGISYLIDFSGADNVKLGTFKTNLTFVSKAARDIVTATDYITILAVSLANAVLNDGNNGAASAPVKANSELYKCIKRKNEKGVTWRTDTAKVATNFPANAAADTAMNVNDSTADSKAYYEGA